MARLHTPICELFGTRLPIVQAPMAGGPSSKELVAACSAAGALGSFGHAYTKPEDMAAQAAFVRAKTDRPFHVNLFLSAQPASISPEAQRAALEAVAPYYAELGLPAPQPAKAPYAPDLEAQLAAVEAIRPAVFTSHLGELPSARLGAFRSLGIRVGGSATCVAEAERLESLGYDFVIAQGGEAGGHRGTWLRDPDTALTGTLALVRSIVRAIRLPVVAAGGIMDGAGIAAVLALGAQAAQLGTAFVPCPESGASQVHKDLLVAAREDDTRMTVKFSGKPARGLTNRYMSEMHARDGAILEFPAQNIVTGKLRAASAQAGKPDFVALWAGQAVALARAQGAAELIARLEAETLEAIGRTASFVKE